MRFRLSLVFFWLVALSGYAAHTRAELLLENKSVRPGDTTTAGIRLKMDPRWHTYWKNSGASGMPTTIEWELPEGIKAGEIQWPTPEKLPEQELTTYIYKDEVMLLVPLRVSADLKTGPLPLKAKVSWLECDVQCVPGSAELSGVLNVGAATEKSDNAETIAAWRAKIPAKVGPELGFRGTWKMTDKPDVRTLVLEWKSTAPVLEPDFFPFSSTDYEIAGETQILPATPGLVRISKQVNKSSGDWPNQVSGLVVNGSGATRIAYEATALVGASPEAAALTSTGTGVTIAPQSLFKMLLYALIGGLILNIMPCVLPVIALKILGFVGQAKESPGRVRQLGLIYAAGVLLSFLLLAAMVIAVKAAGHKAGWGMQFGNPQFLVVLITLVTLVALNLFGLFEITPGGRIMGAAGTLASKHGASGAFFNGVLATILATPCTAPFLGAALGFAFAQPAPIIVLVFLTVGFGLALPYVVLSFQPAWLKFLPKPGPWMLKFKIAMGFPMLATAVWLSGLIPDHYGDRAWWLGIFLVIVALSAWVFGQFYQLSVRRRGVGLIVAVLILLAGYFTVLEAQLDWRSPGTPASNTAMAMRSAGGVSWQPWSQEAVTSARATGKPVLVDFTAKWCLTCNTIVKPALESASVQNKLKETGAVALLGDYTHFPPAITDELNKYGRAGVPLVLVFPRQADQAPIVLPEALTPGMVVAALDKAVQ